MGIRFYCPNGHKLNVKEFQAGRKGICPFCQAKIHIPTQSTRHSSKDRKGEEDSSPLAEPQTGPKIQAPPPGQPPAATSPTVSAGPASAPPVLPSPLGGPAAFDWDPFEAAPADLAAASPTLPTSPPQPIPAATASVASAAAPAAAQPASAAPVGSSATKSAPAAATGGTSAPATAAPDPLVEAGEAAWYVRAADGGQYGPANREIMRGWLSEGRITPNSLVWREGWRDWREAAKVFPQTTANHPENIFESIVAEEISAHAPAELYAPLKSRRRPQTVQTWIIAVLIVAVAILSVVFLLILLSQQPSTVDQEQEEEPRPVASAALFPRGPMLEIRSTQAADTLAT